MSTASMRKQTWKQKAEWFFLGCSNTRSEKTRYFLKRLIWLAIVYSVLHYVVFLVVGCAAEKVFLL